MSSENQIDVQDLGHLGIIAGIVDDIGIVEIIDRELGKHAQEKVSAGQVVKAMILNCMGFLTSPLYLFSEFFAGKATEHLIGAGVTAEHLNKSRLGRVMDQFYSFILSPSPAGEGLGVRAFANFCERGNLNLVIMALSHFARWRELS